MTTRKQGETFDRIYDAVRRVPAGAVATYGDISREVLGHARGARTVGWALRALHDERVDDVPWWRVVNASGRISTGGAGGRGAGERGAGKGDTGVHSAGGCGSEGHGSCVPEQQRLLEAEGVEFDESGRLELEAVRWRGGRPALDR